MVSETSDFNFLSSLKHLSGPLTLSWDITNKCNFNCAHCLNCSNDQSKHDFSDELNKDDVTRLLKQIQDIRPYSMCICGGEPTLSPYLFRTIKEISSVGTIVNMVSNGYLIDDAFAKSLNSAGLSLCQISLDSDIEDEHDSFRGVKGAYRRAINAIKSIVKAKIDLAISFVPTKFNLPHFDNYYRLLESLGCKLVRIMPLLPMGRGLHHFNELEPTGEDYFKFVLDIKKYNDKSNKQLRIEWGDPLEHIYLAKYLPRPVPINMEIKSNGDISPSIYLPISVGNIRRHSLKEYWDAGFNRIWGHSDVMALTDLIHTLEDFKTLSLQTWNIHRKTIDLIDDRRKNHAANK